MNLSHRHGGTSIAWIPALLALLAALATGCGGGLDPVLGSPAAADTTAPTVTATSPAAAVPPAPASTVCRTRSITTTFSEPMNPATITTATFLVADDGTPVAGSVSYNVPTRVATFTPTAASGWAANSTTLVATIKSGSTGVKDLAGNPLASDRVFGFSSGPQACVASANLATSAAYGAFGGAAGVTNQGVNTVVGGRLGTTAACTLVTGFHDAVNVYTETPLNKGATGGVDCGPPAPGTTASLAAATQARADAQTAYNALAALPPGSDPGAGQLGGLVLAPGVYTSASGTFDVTSGNLTLDAQGDSGAVWVFQTGAALTVGLTATPRSVLLVNGAQAANVFWQVGSAARIEDASTMVGTIIAPSGVTFSTAGQTQQTTLIGRAISLTASVTLVNTTITAP